MPQFDPSSLFLSQLFWLIICFGITYLSMSKFFLPRIRDILKDRNNHIDNFRSLTAEIEDKISKIRLDTRHIRSDAISQYKMLLDEAIRNSNIEKEANLQNFRLYSAQMIKQSNVEIAEFTKNSQDNCQIIIKKLVNDISKKFFYSA